MSSYLPKPLSIRQSQHLIKFLSIMFDLELISEGTFGDTAQHFDDYTLEIQRYSWEAPLIDWFKI